MITPPKQPSKAGGLHEHLRQSAAHQQQRGSAMFGGMTTTKGFIPNRTRKTQVQRASNNRQVWL